MNHNKRRPPKHAPDPCRPTLPEWLAVKLDIPADITGDGLRLDMRGRHTLTVHGCRKILDFTPCEVRLALRDATLTVTGGILTAAILGAYRLLRKKRDD